MNVGLRCNARYSTTDQLLSSMTDYLNQIGERDMLANNFCIAETTQQLLDVARLRREWWKDAIESQEIVEATYRTYFVFPSLSEEGLAALGKSGTTELQGYQGFMPYADPRTGFEQAYETRFGTKPTFAECKFYDALLLPALTSYLNEYIETIAPGFYGPLTRNELTNTLIHILGKGRNGSPAQDDQPIWRGNALRQYLNDLSMLSWPAFCGASGYIIFDIECCTQIAQTTYLLWQIDNGRIRHLTYYGPDSKHVTSSSVSWEPFYDDEAAQKDFADMAADQDMSIHYPTLTGQYAVLVQGSNGMNNYRHQADVLSVYQLLRQNGFDDDHIILILDGALALDPQNNEPGVIRNSPVGHDLMGGTDAEENEKWRETFGDGHRFDSEYPAAAVDYSTDSLSASDISDILLGLQSPHLPIVLPQDEGTNVLLYWSGHGRNTSNGGANELVWLETPAGEGFTAERMRQTVEQMSCRKLLAIVEPCYSEGVIQHLQGITGVLAIAGASGDEQSWAENWNAFLGRYGTWMCDRFTLNVVRCLTNDVATTYRDLYLYCQRSTIGSHVRLVNADHFGNLYRTSPEEFFAKAPSNSPFVGETSPL
ncbi:MAG: C13 family peptidase [Bacteroidaceae bacterium]|nr:C13 family peptidase [Bacteroidaceae bacterium]